ncbi:MAG: DUF1622 domain-containing protein [Nitrososphaeraceae archaeon]
MAVDTLEPSTFPRFEALVELIIDYALVLIDFVAVIIIASAIFLTLIYFLKHFKKILDSNSPEPQKIRIRLGKMLLIGLDVLIAADVLKTIVHHGLVDLLVLAVIVAIRIVITWILSKETGSEF